MNKENSIELVTYIKRVNKNITRVVHSYSNDIIKNSQLIDDEFLKIVQCSSDKISNMQGNECIEFKNTKNEVILKEIGYSLNEKNIYDYSPSDSTTNDSIITYGFKKELNDKCYEGKIVFEIDEDECIYGLGQHENGIYNYNGKTEYLYQSNRKISIPFIISSKNYAIFIDSETSMIYESKDKKMSFTLDTVNELSYYVIKGDNFEDIIKCFREMTGKTPMLPRWAFGYIQSKEKYSSSKELIDVSLRFRSKHIPLDCIVQDWCSWEENLWGEKKPDKRRYPDVKLLINILHESNVKLMVSIWPNMSEKTTNLKEFREKNLLLKDSNTYNSYKNEGRKVYFDQCNEVWFSNGTDAFWCDNSEPYDADWCGENKRSEINRYELNIEEDKKHLEWTRLNSYGLMHAKGIYENWRKYNKNKRVVNLTRSTYVSGQKYGVICWSGDITAKWDTLKKQIVEGINFSMCGMPYWTLDIGGFFTVNDKYENRGCGNSNNTNKIWYWDGDYNDGVNDLGYRELYTRWLQYAVFLPIFRSHGTDTPREPWNFGLPNTMFYDAIVKFIKLRYKLLPYIYSSAAEVRINNTVMLKSLMFDFAQDKKVREICDSFMFGRSFLVSPITEPMYYNANSTEITNSIKQKKVYLPQGANWYDFWSNKYYNGGQTIECEADIYTIPVFIKSGSIIPISDPLYYADEKKGLVSEILVYSGDDGEFNLYNDDGDNYSYEDGNYSIIKINYNDSLKTLYFSNVQGHFKYQTQFKIRFIKQNGEDKIINYNYSGKEESIKLI